MLVFITLFEGSKKQRVPPMTSELRICEGLVGPKNGNVEKGLVFIAFLKGQRPSKGKCDMYMCRLGGAVKRKC